MPDIVLGRIRRASLVDQRARPHHGEDRTAAESYARAKAACRPRADQYVRPPDDHPEFLYQGSVILDQFLPNHLDWLSGDIARRSIHCRMLQKRDQNDQENRAEPVWD